MCNPLAIAALAAGVGSQAYGQRQVQRASNNAMQNSMAQQRELQSGINNVVTDGARRDFEVGNMANNYNAAADERTNSLLSVLQGSETNQPVQSNSNDVFSMAQAKAKAKQIETATKLAALMGKAGALGDAGQKRQINMMGDADTVSGIGQDMRRAQQQTQWNLDKAQHKGDNAQLLGSLLMLAGTSAGGKGAGAKMPNAYGGSGASANSMFGNIT